MQLKKVLIGAAAAIALAAGGALAQTYSQFAYLRVLQILDVRTSIQNQDAAENVVIDDNATVTGTLGVTGALTVASCMGCGGGGTPGGADTQVQFNDGGAFGGDAGLTYVKATDALTVAGPATIGGAATLNSTLDVDAGGGTDEINVTSGLVTMPGAATVTGAATLNGATAINNTLDVDAGGGTDEINVTSGLVTFPGAATITGATIMNGNVNVDPGGGNDELAIASGAVAMIGTVSGGASGGIDMTPESGEFTVTFQTACTTDPTVDVDYQRIGNTVTLKLDASSGFPCTSDSTSFTTTGTPVPASLRPTNQNAVCAISPGFTDNTVSASAYMGVSTTGIFSFTRVTVSGANLQVGSWTNSGSKSAASALGGGCSYMLGNP